DDDRLRASMREALPHGGLFHAGPLQRQGLLRIDAQRLVVIRFDIAHSVSFAAASIASPISPATAASANVSSGVPPRYRSSATTRFSTARPAPSASTAACITFVPPNAKPNSASEKSL